MRPRQHLHGFTLIELSIVLVIIGLLVGGVLAGRELMKTAELRALTSQVHQFTAAVNGFRVKYGALPGDMPNEMSERFGFFTYDNEFLTTPLGNNNGMIGDNGWWIEEYCNYECSVFWRHIADAGLLLAPRAELITDPNDLCYLLPVDCWTREVRHLYLPKAEAAGAYWASQALLFSSLSYFTFPPRHPNVHSNAFYLISGEGELYPNRPTLSAVEVSSVDRKSDDGKPNTGRVVALTLDANNWPDHPYWSATEPSDGAYCTFGGADPTDPEAEYNLKPSSDGERRTCIPVFVW
jgi:prepilin-type N-terminal cleavage/methylation domain-containing protein